MTKILSIKEIRELFRSDKKIKLIAAAGALFLVLAVLSGLFAKPSKSASADIGADIAVTEEALEKRLCDILSRIEGIGKVKVMVTLDTAGEREYGRSSDMIASVTAPSVRGVAVVCDGGNSVLIREKVTSAVMGVFGIGASHVSVTK